MTNPRTVVPEDLPLEIPAVDPTMAALTAAPWPEPVSDAGWPDQRAHDAGLAAGEMITCPQCGEMATIETAQRRSEDFCRNCDYPLFWARNSVIAPNGEETGASLRRLPGTVGRAATAALDCPHCGEPNSPIALVCIRCGGDMHPVATPEPLPEPVTVFVPQPEPEPEPEVRDHFWWLLASAVLLLLIIAGIVWLLQR